MNRFFFFISLFATPAICFAQTNGQLDKDTAKYKNAPLYILQLPLADPLAASGIVIWPADIDSVSVFKDSISRREYGPKAANGVIFISSHKSIKMLLLDQLLTHYHITDAGLPVYIDSAIAYKPGAIYFQQAMVKSAKIETEKGTGMKYISICTFFPVHRLKSDDIYIK